MLQFDYLCPKSLIPYARNARKHSAEQIAMLKGSIKEFGFTAPILVRDDLTLIAGHARLQAALELGLEKIPVCKASHLTENQARALVHIDNQMALKSEWDFDALSLELSDIDFNFDPFDFELPETEDVSKEGLTDDDDVPEVEQNIHGVVLGDIWKLGEHRIMCGNSTDIDHVQKLLDGAAIGMVFTDPPYGMNAVSKDGKVGGGTKHAPAKTYKPVLGDEDTTLARDFYNLVATLNIPKIIIWGGNYFTDFLPPSPCWIVWDKERPEGLTFADGEVAWTNFTTPLKFIRHRWDGYHRASERDQSRVHPTQKPSFLGEWCFKEYGDKGDNVLDLFLGSGSTLIACEKTNRKCYGMELDTHYCSVIIERWQKFTGKKAERII